MTYCAAWKYKNSVFLIADTAVSSQSPPRTKYSSFGQLHDLVRGQYVEERALKLVPIGHGTIVAFAGDLEVAQRCLVFLRDHGPAFVDTIGLLDSMTASLGPFDRSPQLSVELIIATSNSSGATGLHCWNTAEGRIKPGRWYYDIGGLVPSPHASATLRVVNFLTRGNLDEERLLPIVSGHVQAYGVNDNLIDKNVGGLVLGIRTCLGQVAWQDDTNYVLYGQDLVPSLIVVVRVRDDVVMLHSSQGGPPKFLANSASQGFGAGLDQARLERIESASFERVRYWVFIGTAYRAITLVNRPDPDAESLLVKLKELGDHGNIDLAVSDELRATLILRAGVGPDQTVPFQMNFFDD